MNHYRAGADFERRIRDRYEVLGFTVIRSAGSRGRVDLVALRPGEVHLIQCKHGLSARMSAQAKRELLALAASCGAVAVEAWGFGPITQVVELASGASVG